MEESERYYAFDAGSDAHAKHLAAKGKRHFGFGAKRGTFVVVGPCSSKPWAWREALPSGGNWDMHSGWSPEEAAEKAGVQF